MKRGMNTGRWKRLPKRVKSSGITNENTKNSGGSIAIIMMKPPSNHHACLVPSIGSPKRNAKQKQQIADRPKNMVINIDHHGKTPLYRDGMLRIAATTFRWLIHIEVDQSVNQVTRKPAVKPANTL